MFGDNKVKNLALFSKSAIVESNGPPATASVKDFITNLNNNNSGITDSLCKLISAIVREDCVVINNEQKTISTMNNKFLNVMTDTITSLGLNFVESVLSDPGLSDDGKIMVRDFFFQFTYKLFKQNYFAGTIKNLRVLY